LEEIFESFQTFENLGYEEILLIDAVLGLAIKFQCTNISSNISQISDLDAEKVSNLYNVGFLFAFSVV
jgi:hypothetical protein